MSADELDGQIVTMLRRDSRQSVTDIAGALRVTRGTVQARISRMEGRGDILGYTVVLRADAVSAPVRGLVFIDIEGRQADRVLAALGGFAEIAAIHTTNGRWDAVAEISADSLTALDAILRRIRMVPGIAGSETHLLLATTSSTRARL